MNMLGELALIYRVIGPRSVRATIRAWLAENWKRMAIVKFLPKGFFVAIFTSKQDRDEVAQGGVWKLNGWPIYMELWSPNFDPVKSDPYEGPIWIRLYNLPLEFWVKDCIEKIGRTLGTLLDVDSDIFEGDSYLYARIQIAAISRVP